jgi:hypothetical protein
VKTKNILLTSLIIGSFLGCDPDPVETTNNDITDDKKISKGTVQLGFTEGATVSINSLDGHTFMDNITTNSKGEYSVNQFELKKAIADYNPSLKMLLIISDGGTDTDPDDDGVIVEDEKKEVKGQVKSIVPLEKFLDEKVQSVNLITTAITELIGDVSEVSEQKILQIAEALGVEDITGDGKITLDDLIYYQMAEHESKAESYLRTNFLDDIHNNNYENIKIFIREIKMSQSIISPIIKHDNNGLTVKFSDLSSNNYIRYGLKEDSTEVSYTSYSGEEIDIPTDSVLYFQECTESNECFKLQKVLYDGKNYFLDYLNYETVSEFFTNKDDLLTLKADVKTQEDKINTVSEEIRELETKLEEVDNSELVL